MALHSEEARLKSIETRKNNLPQISNPGERETHINIDYFEEKIKIYTNNATVINRMARNGYEFTKEEYLDGEVYSRTYEFPLNMISKFATGTIFK